MMVAWCDARCCNVKDKKTGGQSSKLLMGIRWKKAMEAVHRVKLLLLLADFKGVKSAVPEIVERYQVTNQPSHTMQAVF